ncbi:MAG TPA: membrane protein insertase YidC [Methylomirabilota bacterium]|nr:membrane protein insertase YidC [Methylomirabilota bacterium]
MEKRALVAIVLSVALLLAWQAFFAPPSSTPPPPSGSPGSGSPPPAPGAPPAPATSAPSPTAPSEGPAAIPRPAGGPPGGRTAEVLTPLYRATFGPTGATSWTLNYRGPKPLIVGEPLAPLAVSIQRPGQPAEVVPLAPETERLELGRDQPTGTLSFTGTAADGLRVERILRFRADSYRVEAELRLVGGGGPPGPVTVGLFWTGPVGVPGPKREDAWLTFGEGPDRRQLLGRILIAQNGRPEHFEAPASALKDPREAGGGTELKDPHLVPVAVLPPERRWVALENDYYIAALVASGGARVLRGRERDLAEVGVVFPERRLGPGERWDAKAELYVGPKEWDRLKAMGVGLEQAQARNYGDFLWTLPMEWFCVPLLWLMNFFATRVPGENYGVAIILLTVLVKIAFYPLTQKSMSSMKQMQALQPQLNALRAKYKSDPQRFQREQMELFRKHKVNPMGGCLPMVVQIPIFYALYLTLQYSVELQGAAFVLWITDLSKKDPYYVLPILMGGSMLVQQKMTPSVGDPRQAKVMLIMPVIFTFMFLEFPTGLVLYWLVNNVLSIAQQYLIDRAARAKALAATEPKGDKERRKA